MDMQANFDLAANVIDEYKSGVHDPRMAVMCEDTQKKLRKAGKVQFV